MIIKELPADELHRIGEIDRSERVTLGYVCKDGKLETQAVDWNVPRWGDDPTSDFSVAAQVNQWAPILKEGGTLLGALDGDSLTGFAVLRNRLSEGTAQLAALYVDRAYRRRGLATGLANRVDELARAAGATSLYVSAVPSESAVGFYLRHGFRLADQVNAELFTLEPEDIHMIKELG